MNSYLNISHLNEKQLTSYNKLVDQDFVNISVIAITDFVAIFQCYIKRDNNVYTVYTTVIDLDGSVNNIIVGQERRFY
jgi:hypothetical protein